MMKSPLAKLHFLRCAMSVFGYRRGDVTHPDVLDLSITVFLSEL